MEAAYLVDIEKDGSIRWLIRMRDDGAIEYLANGKWLPEPHALSILKGEMGVEITVEEAREIAPRFGGTIDLD